MFWRSCYANTAINPCTVIMNTFFLQHFNKYVNKFDFIRKLRVYQAVLSCHLPLQLSPENTLIFGLQKRIQYKGLPPCIETSIYHPFLQPAVIKWCCMQDLYVSSTDCHVNVNGVYSLSETDNSQHWQQICSIQQKHCWILGFGIQWKYSINQSNKKIKQQECILVCIFNILFKYMAT